MIIKNFLNKIHISFYTYIFIFLCFITGLIKSVILLYLLIIFHEFGHYIISYMYKWNIKRINIYPFGGLIEYDDLIDKPFKEELLVTLFGPLNQILIYILFFIFNKINYLDNNTFNNINGLNYTLLLFNILPIIPLDGSKLLNIFINKIFNYKLSYKILGIISFITLIIFIYIYKNNYNYLIYTVLIYELYYYIKNYSIKYNRFLLEKYLYINNFKKYLKINNINKMKRNRKHLIKNNNIYITEKEYLKKGVFTPNKVYNMVHNKDMDKQGNNN